MPEDEPRELGQPTTTVSAVVVVVVWLVLAGLVVFMLSRGLDAGWVAGAGIVKALVGVFVTTMVLL